MVFLCRRSEDNLISVQRFSQRDQPGEHVSPLLSPQCFTTEPLNHRHPVCLFVPQLVQILLLRTKIYDIEKKELICVNEKTLVAPAWKLEITLLVFFFLMND